MYTNSKSRLVTAIFLTATWLLTAAAIAQESMMNHGMMENGHWFGFGGIGLSMLAIAIVGAVLFALLRRRQ